MADTTVTVQSIVDTNCSALLAKMQADHPGADVGISVALFYPGDSDVPGFFKYGSAGPGVDFTAETIFAIGSVTKVFTATLAAYLNVQKIIGDLDQTLIAPFLSNDACSTSGVSGSYWESATFGQFATHTSGMPDEAAGSYSVQLFADEPPSCPELAWWNDKQGTFAEHQGLWLYSSAGFVTLGFGVVAAAAKAGLTGGYTSLLESIITTEIGMPNTFAADDVPANAVLAQGYNNSKPVPITDAADLKSSAQDMSAWLAAVYQAMEMQASGGTLTPLQQALAITTDVWITRPENWDKEPMNFDMGLAWQIPTLGSAQVLIKNGSTSKGGCSCWVGLTRYSSTVPPVGIALMTNQVGVRPDATASAILQQIVALG